MQTSFLPTPTPAQPATQPKTGTLIYEPRGRAREYADLACNLYRGCGHGCTYCYAPDAIQMSRGEFGTPKTRGGDFLKKLDREAGNLHAGGLTGQVLLCFSCDPYQPLDDTEQITRKALMILHRHGFKFCTLTKGGSRALRDIDLFNTGDAFASTLTFLSDEQSLKWEPGAALPWDRIDTLRKFHAAGIFTWVSLEPVIDPRVTLDIIKHTHGFVDFYKVGKLNHHPLAKEIDWRSFGLAAIELLKQFNRPYYIKKDLAAYLEG